MMGASGVPARKPWIRPVMGMMVIKQMTPTIQMGRSRSVRGRLSYSPWLDLIEARTADMMPPHTGMASRPRVQTEAVAIAPAPMNRTLVFQIACATSAAGPIAGYMEDRMGVAIPQAMTTPAAMATPTATPIRCPNRAEKRKGKRPADAGRGGGRGPEIDADLGGEKLGLRHRGEQGGGDRAHGDDQEAGVSTGLGLLGA